MTSRERFFIAVIALVCGVGLSVTSAVTGDQGLLALGTTLITAPVAYAFGDQNGEKRLARALTVLEAEKRLAEQPPSE